MNEAETPETRIGARALWQIARDLGWDGVECGSAYAYIRYRLSLPPIDPWRDHPASERE